MERDLAVVLDPTGRDIHAEAARIRAQGPVAPIELPGGVLAWSVTGYDAARRVLADERFSKDPRAHWTAYANGEIGPEFPLIAWARMENMTTSHGEAHSRQRRLVLTAFTPRRVETMRAGIEKLVAELLDGLGVPVPGATVDLKMGFAHPLASRVIGDLIGIPAEARTAILGDGYAAGGAAKSPAEAAAAFALVREGVLALIADKRRSPGDDLATDLIAAQDEGSRMTDLEIASTILLLLNTGTEPAMNLILNATAALLTHPAQRELIRTRQVTWSDAIEETLRVQAPVAHLPFRFAVNDVEIEGVTIRRGDPVLVHFAGVGRDPAAHGEDADAFDVTRADKKHLSFGHGVYRCIGSSLAWLETELALDALFRRFPGLALAADPAELAPQGTFIMNGYAALPVRLA
ncbi:cytochrome P450 [Longispora sp. K20-0274]|uniref:cytochrome P450 family protein n=1 Tax=Longispora sp. K20-0274 TaxID=3088255 RepID=UPI00399AD468